MHKKNTQTKINYSELSSLLKFADETWKDDFNPYRMSAHGRKAILFELNVQHYFHISQSKVVKKYQENKLKRILLIAKRIPVYINLWRKYGCKNNFKYFPISRLTKLPIITKNVFRAQWPDGAYDHSANPHRFYVTRSTGSTGIPFRAYADRMQDPISLITYWQAYLEAGSDLCEKKVFLVAPWTRKIWAWLKPKKLIPFDFTKFYLDKGYFVKILPKLTNVEIIEGAPSHLIDILRAFKKNDIRLKIKIVMYSWEQILNGERKLLEEYFGCAVFSYYGMNELGCIGFECKAHKGIHINERSYIVEILNNKDRRLPDRSCGRVIITSLVNEVMPFIRYDTGDWGAIDRSPCACGRLSPRLFLEGRRDDFILLPKNRRIHSFIIYEIFYPFWKSFWKYQLVQNEDVLKVYIIPTDYFSQEIKNNIICNLKKLLGRKIRIAIQPVAAIPTVKNKHKVILRAATAAGKSDLKFG